VSARRESDRGSATVTAVVLVFAFTSLGVIWLARDVDRSLSNRSAARSIAFQAARSGAQAVDVHDLRSRSDGVVRLDPRAAIAAANRTAARLLESYGLQGDVADVAVDGDLITVTIEVRDPAGVFSGSATARSEERG
jgi:hypothetical protein